MILRLVNSFLLIAIVIIIPLIIAGLIIKVPFVRYILFQIISLVFSLALIFFISKGNLSGFGFNKVAPRKIVLPVIYMLITALVFSLTLNIIFKFLNIESVSPFPKVFNSEYFWFPLLFAGIVEEVAVRGLIQSLLSPLRIYGIRFINTYISLPVILSAALFGMIHLNIGGPEIYTTFSIKQALFAVVIGLMIAYYREKFDSIIPAIVMHVSCNFVFGVLPVLIVRYFIKS